MRKCLVLTLAVLAVAALPTLALADDAKNTNASTASVAQLSDTELDNVTAGNPGGIPNANASWGQNTARAGLCQHGGCQYGNSLGHRQNP